MINIDNQQDFRESALLERAARLTLEISTRLDPNLEPDSVDADITIVLTDDAQLHELNREFLGVDAPTDVLSFPSDEVDPETGSQYLGDIIISIPRAAQQAQVGGTRWKRKCSCWWCMALCICWVTIMLRRRKKPVCGLPRPRLWEDSACLMSKYRIHNQSEGVF